MLNNEKMISVFILYSFLEYKKEIKPDYKKIFKNFSTCWKSG